MISESNGGNEGTSAWNTAGKFHSVVGLLSLNDRATHLYIS